MKLIESLDP